MTWYRIITPTSELKTLSFRDKLDDQQIGSQRIRCVRGYDSVINPFPEGFTALSAFQYLVSDAKQHLFKKPSIGILIAPRGGKPRKVTWRNSLRSEVSDSLFKKYLPKADFENSLKEKNFERISEQELRRKVTSEFQKLQIQYQQEGLNPADAALPLTEGLFRYQTKEIVGIVIDLNDSQSCKIGYAFSFVILKINKIKNITFYKINENNYPERVSLKPFSHIISENLIDVTNLINQYTDSYFS